MRRAALAVAVAIFLIVLNTNAFARRHHSSEQLSPVAITQCGNITQPGNYVLTNDLELAVNNPPAGGDCLTISAAHVNIDMGGFAITAFCPNFPGCVGFFGPVGGTGIHILDGADHVSISNGQVGAFIDGGGGFVDGIVAEADHTSVNHIRVTAVVGLTLTNVTHSSFADISYAGADPREHAVNGPILHLAGGGKNTFTGLSGETGGDLGANYGMIVNSDGNTISGANINNTSNCGGTGIGLSGSYNVIENSVVFDDCSDGISVSGNHNLITGNTVTILATAMDFFAMVDANADCGSDLWTNNLFSNQFQPGQISASPEGCIH